MSEFNLLAATRTLEKSMAYVLYRFLLSFGVGLGYLFAALAGAGTLVGFASLAKNASAIGPIGAVLGFAAFGYLMYKIRPFWLRVVKAPHLALLAAQAKGEALPAGKALVDFAKQRLAQKFPSASALFETDGRVRATLREIPTLLPQPQTVPIAHPKLKEFALKALGWLFARNHQSILAWHFYSGADDFRRTAATALPVQKQHYGTLLKYRLYASLFEVVGFAAAFPLLAIGIEKLVDGIPIAFGVWPYVFAGVFAWTLQAAFFEPIAEAAMMEAFFPLAAQGADPAEEEALAQHSEGFRALQQQEADKLDDEQHR
jgi:hypothetical protein